MYYITLIDWWQISGIIGNAETFKIVQLAAIRRETK